MQATAFPLDGGGKTRARAESPKATEDRLFSAVVVRVIAQMTVLDLAAPPIENTSLLTYPFSLWLFYRGCTAFVIHQRPGSLGAFWYARPCGAGR